MDSNPVMLGVFIAVAVIFIVLYVVPKKKYAEFLDPLDSQDFKLKPFMHMGLFIMSAVHYQYGTKYDRNLITKINEIYGAKYSMYYLQIHWAYKITFLLLALLFLSLIGMGVEPGVEFGVFSLMALAGIVYLTDHELNDKIKKRRLSIQMDFPDFLNKLTLLINAGMTVGRAWEKIVTDNKKSRVLYDELGLVLADIRAGKPEMQAYEDFARKCKMPEITKFVSVILTNMKKGSGELVHVLRYQAKECWDMRKNAAKRLGEEASTKMLFPMMIMFFAILLIVAVPAVLSMQAF